MRFGQSCLRRGISQRLCGERCDAPSRRSRNEWFDTNRPLCLIHENGRLLVHFEVIFPLINFTTIHKSSVTENVFKLIEMWYNNFFVVTICDIRRIFLTTLTLKNKLTDVNHNRRNHHMRRVTLKDNTQLQRHCYTTTLSTLLIRPMNNLLTNIKYNGSNTFNTGKYCCLEAWSDTLWWKQKASWIKLNGNH